MILGYFSSIFAQLPENFLDMFGASGRCWLFRLRGGLGELIAPHPVRDFGLWGSYEARSSAPLKNPHKWILGMETILVYDGIVLVDEHCHKSYIMPKV